MKLNTEILDRIKNEVAKTIKSPFVEFWKDLNEERKNNLWPEVCRRYAEEVLANKGQDWFMIDLNYKQEISQLKKQLVELEAAKINDATVKALLKRPGIVASICSHEIAKNKKLEEENAELKSKLEVKEKPDFELHNVIMQQWEKDFKSIHSEQVMDAYTVSGFIRNIIFSELLRDAAIAERDAKIQELNDIISGKTFWDRDARIEELEEQNIDYANTIKERDARIAELEKLLNDTKANLQRAYNGLNSSRLQTTNKRLKLKIDLLEEEIKKLEESRLASIKASLEKAAKNGKIMEVTWIGEKPECLDKVSIDESSITDKSNIVIIP